MTVLPISSPPAQIPSSSQELIQRAIDSQDYETALTEMVLLGNSFANKGDTLLHFLHDKILILIPLIRTEGFATLTTLIMPNVLEHSSHLFEKQCQLATALGTYYFQLGNSQEEQKLSLHKTALHYFLIAQKIAQAHHLPHESIPSITPIFSAFIEDNLIKTSTFEKICGTLTGKTDKEGLEKLWRKGRQLAPYFPSDLFAKLHATGKSGHVNRMTPSNQKLFSSLSEEIATGFSSNTPAALLTQRWRTFLQDFRKAFNEESQDLKTYQENLTRAFKERFFIPLLEDAFFLLGPPPCAFDIRAMGSLARNALSLTSDLEYFILIEKKEAAPYFKTLAFLLELQFITLGETVPPGDLLTFSALGKPLEGMHIDIGGNPFINETIDLPASLAENFFCGNEDGYGPNSLPHTLLCSTSLLSKGVDLFPVFAQEMVKRLGEQLGAQTRRAKRFTALKQKRLEDFEDLHRFTNFKTQYIEPLFHFISDLGMFYGIQELNTLDIVDALKNKRILPPETAHLLKESLSILYQMRIGKVPHDERLLTQIEHLVIKPLYSLVRKESDFTEIDLIHEAFEETKTPQDMSLFVQGLHSFILEGLLPGFYEKLSLSLRPLEPLRKAFLEAVKDPNLKQDLALVPNPKGYRQIERIKREEFHGALLNILSPYEEKSSQGFSIQLSGPHLDNQKLYLKREIMEEILDPKTGDLQGTYANTHSRVTLSKKHQLHFKQAPSNPSKESPFHPGKERAASSLMFRLFGHGTSVGELVEFTVDHPKNGKKSYLVQISKTIPGTNLADASKQELQTIDQKNLTDFFLSLPLLLPGDMRPANMIVRDRKLVSIDNDVSWVYPMTKAKPLGYEYHLYTILPFLFPQHMLHPTSIEKFLSLKSGPLLVDWLEELIAYNEGVQKHFSRYEDVAKGVSIRALFEKGIGGQLFSQFVRFQTFLHERQGAIPALDVFKAIISFHEDKTTDIGQKLYERYAKGLLQKGTPSDQVKWVTSRDAAQSMSATKSTASFYKNLPTSEEGLKDYLPQKLLQEISSLLVLDFGNFFFQNNQGLARLEKGFEEIPDSAQQEILLKALTQHRYEVLNLSHCVALTDEALAVFLKKSQATLKTLTLRHCSQLTVKALPLIMACPNLEELYLSHSSGIERFVIPRTVVKDLPVQFPKLQILHLSNCPSLTTFNIQALELKVLKVDNNPRLRKGILEAPGCEVISENSPLKLEWGVQSQVILRQQQQKVIEQYGAFGKKKWEQYFGDSGIEPILPPNIQEILSATCPIYPDKKVYETHLLTLIPQTVNEQPLTLKTLGEFVQKPLQGPATKYSYLSLGEYKDPPVPASHWTLLSRDVILNSRNKRYAAQQELVPQYPGYEIPHILDATVSIFMEHVQSGTRLYSDKPYTYTRCQEKYNASWQLAVGGFAAGGLAVHYDLDDESELNGVGLSRLF